MMEPWAPSSDILFTTKRIITESERDGVVTRSKWKSLIISRSCVLGIILRWIHIVNDYNLASYSVILYNELHRPVSNVIFHEVEFKIMISNTTGVL